MAIDVPAALRPSVAQAKHLLGSFARHFGGRPHHACDRRLLRELIERLAALVPAIAELPELHAAAGLRLEMLRELAREIDARDLPGPVEYAGHLAARANHQFALFQRLVAGRPLARPAVVERIVANLTEIQAEMQAIPLAAIPNPRQHEANLALVIRELAKVREVATAGAPALPAPERLRLLAAAAEAEREDYRRAFEGRERSTIDLDRLGAICDRMGELAFELAELPGELARETLSQACANLDAFELEYNLCADHRKRHLSFGHVVRSAAELRAELLAADAPEPVRRQAVAQLDALLADPVVSELAGVGS